VLDHSDSIRCSFFICGQVGQFLSFADPLADGCNDHALGDNCAVAGGLIDGSFEDAVSTGVAQADALAGLETGLSLAENEGLIVTALSRGASDYAKLAL
jgi:hypothetical protein